MSKSLKRVRNALRAAKLDADIREMPVNTRTAAQAAEAAGCELNQIMKSIIFQGDPSGEVILFLTAGGNQVDPVKAGRVAGERLVKADAELVRTQTGFAIGGVAPVDHLNPIRIYIDTCLLKFDRVWAAAGTPRHIFCADPSEIQRMTGAEEADFLVDQFDD